jgi:hypothetical protein
MRLAPRVQAWFRLAVLMWASLWVLAAPFFHVHPEADHRHGQSGHIHGGTVHTVWSPDLDCEFDNHRRVVRAGHSVRESVGERAPSAHMGDGHTEFCLSLLHDSSDQKSLTQPFAKALGFVCAVGSAAEACSWAPPNIVSVQPSVPSPDPIFSRGPPRPLV